VLFNKQKYPMAKLGSFFRRIFTQNSSDGHSSSSVLTTEPKKTVLIIPPSSPSKLPITSRSCTVSPRPSSRMVIKQTTIHHDNNINETSNTNFLSSNTYRINDRRLSAPLIIHSSTYHGQYRSTTVNESIEEALISSLHRLSLSSPTATTAHPSNSINSLGTNSIGSACASPRPDVRSASLNLSPSNSLILPSSLSNNLVNNISPASGRWRRISFFLIIINFHI
jgi:hypothetical protein